MSRLDQDDDDLVSRGVGLRLLHRRDLPRLLEGKLVATVKDTAKLLALKAKIEAMTPPNRLRLCAGLIEQGEYDMAETLAGNVVDELRAWRLLRNGSRKG